MVKNNRICILLFIIESYINHSLNFLLSNFIISEDNLSWWYEHRLVLEIIMYKLNFKLFFTFYSFFIVLRFPLLDAGWVLYLWVLCLALDELCYILTIVIPIADLMTLAHISTVCENPWRKISIFGRLLIIHYPQAIFVICYCYRNNILICWSLNYKWVSFAHFYYFWHRLYLYWIYLIRFY